MSELADCAKAALERDGSVALSYGSTLGYAPLREWLAERHGVEPGRVLESAAPGVPLRAGVARRRGTRVLIERPTYDRPRRSWPRPAWSWVRSRSTPKGSTSTHSSRRSRPPAAFLYAIPTFQNPDRLGPSVTGAVASRSSYARAGCRCWRTTRTGSFASRATHCRRCSSSRAGSTSCTRRRSRRRLPLAFAWDTRSCRKRSRPSSRTSLPRPTSRRRCSRRRPSTSSCAGASSNRASSACGSARGSA